MQINYLLYCFALSIGFSSCFQTPKVVMPEYMERIDTIIHQMKAIGHFNNIHITTSKSQTNLDRPSVQLEIRLIDGPTRSKSSESLDSLARVMVRIARINTKNWEAFDWVTVIFATSNGEPASDVSNKTVFVFRPDKVN